MDNIRINNGDKSCPKCKSHPKLIPIWIRGVRYLKCPNALPDVKKCDYVISDIKNQAKEWGVG